MRSEQERRALPRETESHPAGLRSLRFRAGASVDVVDVSPSGALIETDRYLGPGTTVEMVMALGRGSIPLRVRVAHARVCRLTSGCRPLYRVGVCFLADPTAPAPPRVVATQPAILPDGRGQHYPDEPSSASGLSPATGLCRRSDQLARALERSGA